MCVPLERETERLRERERETERKKRRREKERERERERRGEEREERKERTPPEDLPSFRAKLLFHFFFCARKQTTFPPIIDRVTVRQSALGLTYMRKGDYDGAIIEADLALRIACALPPPPPLSFMVVAYCTFSTPPQSLLLNVDLALTTPASGTT